MKATRTLSSIAVVILLLAALFLPNDMVRVARAASACNSSSPSSGAYTVTVCLTAPASGSALTGTTTVSATVSVTGTSPGVQRMVFLLSGGYLLTDYQSPYTYNLPTARWVDGSYTLGIQAVMRDSFTSASAVVNVTFKNNVTTPVVNTNSFTPTSGTSPSGGPFVVMAAGDGASGEANATKVVNLIAAASPNLFLYLGDVYEKGTPTEFYNWYGANGTYFGQFRSITDPTIGNHEYSASSTAGGYFDFWDNVPNYYSFDAGGWHFISLNSNSSRIGVGSGSPQYTWLQKDLSAHSSDCTIVYYHHPLFNIGPEGATTQMSAIWSLLAQNHVTIVLNGHDHDYQRWVPLDGSGSPSASGVTEFVAGGGGHGVQAISKTDSRVAYANSSNPGALGALKLSLSASGASFSYKNISGTVLDSGTIPCAAAPADTQAPSVPTGLAATAASATQVNLSWQASTDNVGVAGYTVYRDTAVLATVSGATLAYADTTAQPQTTYSYTVDAFDQAGNHSAPSSSVSVTTPAQAASTVFVPSADAYVNSGSPTTNYGKATTLRADASPDVHSYLRFTVQGLNGKQITRARLLIYSNSSSSQGITALQVADNTWGETTITYSNAPALGSAINASGAITTGAWATIDVTAYVTAEGTYNFGVNTPSATALSLASRESGATAPQLVLDLQ